MAKLTCKKVKEMMKDERKGRAEYNKFGLKNLAKDEGKHYKFLKKLKCR